MLGEAIGVGLIAAARALSGDERTHLLQVRHRIQSADRVLSRLDALLEHPDTRLPKRTNCQSMWRLWNEADRTIAMAIDNSRYVTDWDSNTYERIELGKLAGRFTRYEQRIMEFCHG